jgi:hypothetical protein
MVELRAKSVAGYLLELLAGAAAILGILLLVGGVVRVNVPAAIAGLALIAGAVLVFKWPSRPRRGK